MSAVEASAVPQHLQALAKAQRVKVDRARLIRMVETGELTLAAALDEPALATMMLLSLLEACPYATTSQRQGTRSTTGRRRATRTARGVCLRAGVNEARQVGKLTDRQASVVLTEYLSTARGTEGR